MGIFTDQQLHEIRGSAYELASEEIHNRGIFADNWADRLENIQLLADWLYSNRDRWASFDEDAEPYSYETVIADFFGESDSARAFADYFGVNR